MGPGYHLNFVRTCFSTFLCKIPAVTYVSIRIIDKTFRTDMVLCKHENVKNNIVKRDGNIICRKKL